MNDLSSYEKRLFDTFSGYFDCEFSLSIYENNEFSTIKLTFKECILPETMIAIVSKFDCLAQKIFLNESRTELTFYSFNKES